VVATRRRAPSIPTLAVLIAPAATLLIPTAALLIGLLPPATGVVVVARCLPAIAGGRLVAARGIVLRGSSLIPTAVTAVTAVSAATVAATVAAVVIA
jgi:hypothetical protein